jgi:hypothetical protein
MKLHCGQCGKPISTEIPDGTVVRAWIECPECCETMSNSPIRIDPELKQTAVRLAAWAHRLRRVIGEHPPIPDVSWERIEKLNIWIIEHTTSEVEK